MNSIPLSQSAKGNTVSHIVEGDVLFDKVFVATFLVGNANIWVIAMFVPLLGPSPQPDTKRYGSYTLLTLLANLESR